MASAGMAWGLTITMTLRYVNHVEGPRPIPKEIFASGARVADPGERVIAMLGARYANSDRVRGNSVERTARADQYVTNQ